MECLPEIIDDFTHGAAEESTVRNTTWGVFKANAFCLVISTHPLTVEDMKTRYGPSRFLTSGSGMAAASSIQTNSAWPNLAASLGWIYWKCMWMYLKPMTFKNTSGHWPKLKHTYVFSYFKNYLKILVDNIIIKMCTCIVCLCSLNMFTLMMALLNSGFVDWTNS